MKRLLFFAFLAWRVVAQTNSVYLATPGTGYCVVTAATNASPMVVTVSDEADCGIGNGSTVVGVDINGNYAVNVRAETAGDKDHLAFTVSDLGTDGLHKFRLKDLAGNYINGSGGFVNYSANPGRVRKVTAYPVRDQYGLYLDGAGNPFYNAMLDTSSTGRKHTNNPTYNQMASFTDIYKGGTWKWGWARKYNASVSAGGIDEPYALTILGALKYFLDGDTGARDRAIADLNAPDQVGGTIACNLSEQCGTPSSGQADYQRQLVGYQAVAFDLVKGSMTSQQKLDMLEFWFRDLCWNEGGIDYTSRCTANTPWTKAVWKIGYTGTSNDLTKGTVTWSAGGTTVTGSSTNFVVDGAAAGDIIYLPHPSENGYAEPCKIASLSASSITCEGTLTTTGGGGGNHYAVGPGWNPAGTNLGQEWQSKYYGVQSFCGNCTNYSGSTAPDFQNNLTIAGMIGQIQKGLAGCAEGDQRACVVVTRQGEQFVDLTLRPMWVINSNGFNADNPGYNAWRMNAANAEIIAMFKNGLVGGPDYGATNFLPGIVRNAYHGWISGLDRFLPWAEPQAFSIDASKVRGAFAAKYQLAGSSTPVKEYQYWLNTLHTYNSSFVRDAAQKGQYMWWLYLFHDPAITATTPVLTALGSNDYTQCVSWFGSAKCASSSTAQMNTVAEWGGFWSRSAWTAAATYVAGYFHAWGQIGHSSSAPPGQVHVYRNSKCLICGDDATFYGGFQQFGVKNGSMPIPGGDSNVNNIPVVSNVVTNPWGFANDNFGFVRSVLTTIYKSPVTLVERQVLDFKGKGTLIHDFQTAGSAILPGSYVQMGLNGCGTAASSSCLSINTGALTFGNLQTGAGILSKAFGLNGTTIVLSTENGGTDFSYSGSNAKTGRVKIARSANGTSAEWVLVSQTNANVGGETLCNSGDIVISTAGNHTIIECKDASTPFVGALARGGATDNSLTFSTTFSGTGRYGITALDAAVYNVTRNAAAVTGSPFTVTASERSLTWDGSSGSIVISQASAPTITTASPLPNGTVGVVYSQTLAATGGTGPYTWSLVSGILPAGTSLSSGGVLSGTPTTATVYNFRVRATDSLSVPGEKDFQVTVDAAPAPTGGQGKRGVGRTVNSGKTLD